MLFGLVYFNEISTTESKSLIINCKIIIFVINIFGCWMRALCIHKYVWRGGEGFSNYLFIYSQRIIYISFTVKYFVICGIKIILKTHPYCLTILKRHLHFASFPFEPKHWKKNSDKPEANPGTFFLNTERNVYRY